MLHVTNGSVALSRLHDLGLPGQIVPWDDVLHEGPVPAGVSEDALRRMRAEFLSTSADEVESIERSLRARDASLAAAASGDEIVLWFEHDLYDQLHVLQVLDHLARLTPPPTATVTAILADDYLAAQPDHQLQAWFDARTQLTPGQWQAAAAAWKAFRAPDPSALAAYDHPGAWRTLRAAVRRHLEQFPSVATGLSRTETQTMRALVARPLSLRAAFREANYEVEEAIFMGDLGWWYHIRSLIRAPHPLVSVVGEPPEDFNHPEWWRDDDEAAMLRLTDAGARVLGGATDRIVLNGIDRWLGGVHLHSGSGPQMAQIRRGAGAEPIWRWDEARGTLHSAP